MLLHRLNEALEVGGAVAGGKQNAKRHLQTARWHTY